jgi:hypothetical protein
MPPTLPQPARLYFQGNAVFDTGFIFDFETQRREAHHVGQMLDHLHDSHPNFQWSGEGVSFEIGGSVDNFSPPKVRGMVSVDVSEAIERKVFPLRIDDHHTIECRISNVRADIYLFNVGVMQFRIDVPAETWTDLDTLRRVRKFIQQHNHPPEDFGLNVESLLGPSVGQIRRALTEAAHATRAPLLDTPYLNFMMVLGGFETEIRWTHATLVALMPEPFDPNGEHFKPVLLNVNPDGIQNFASREDHFAFVESGDSLVCLPAVEAGGRSPEQIAYEDWVQWIALHQYTWKMAWELDRGMYAVLNAVTSELKNKRASGLYRDVHALTALLNYIWLLLDTHVPHNMTLVYHSIHFLRRISQSWLTDVILQGAHEKMATLRELIAQLDEMEQIRRARALEFFLTIVGVFSLGSLVLDFLGAMSFAAGLTDLQVGGVVVGILAVFMALAYRLSR